MADAYFPEKAIAVLRAARFDPKAKPGLELLSGSLIWDDECYLEFVATCGHYGCMAYWEPVAYRTSLIRGRPDERYRRGWEELLRVCPQWPGFRAQRRDQSLRAELERQLAEECGPATDQVRAARNNRRG
jgi:hypothetical protein